MRVRRCRFCFHAVFCHIFTHWNVPAVAVWLPVCCVSVCLCACVPVCVPVYLRVRFVLRVCGHCRKQIIREVCLHSKKMSMRCSELRGGAAVFSGALRLLLLQSLLLLLLLACGPAACHARDEVNFDFGWRFRLGATAPPAPPPAPSKPKGCAGQFAFKNASGLQCDGLQNTAAATTADACEAACCNDNSCGVWQFSTESTGGGCWRGLCTGPMTTDLAWVGGQRKPPIQPPAPAPPIGPNPPEAQPGYNDSTTDWTTVNAPHDSLIAAAPSLELCPDGCSGHSYIPRYPSWYRKHFQLPSAWEAHSAIYLYFGATFRETTLWVNGVNVSTHESGYTSYGLRLDNIPGLKFGAGNENLIAIYVDPNIGRSGWW